MWQPTHVKVTVKQAINLIAKGKNGTNDSFVVIGIGKEKFQTSIKEKSTSPVDWREECELAIPSQGNKASVQLTVYHHNGLGLDEFLGQVSIPLSDFDVYEKPKYKSYRLKGKPEKDKKKGEKERGELEVMVNFTVKSEAFLDAEKKEKHKSSITSLKHLGGSLMSLGSKEKQGLKNFAKSVSSKMDKIAKPKKKKNKVPSNSASPFPNDLMTSQQHYGYADPGVISDEEDDFRFDEDIKVNTRTSSPVSTMSRGSSLLQDQVLDTDYEVGSYEDHEQEFSCSLGRTPPKPPRIVDETKEASPSLRNRMPPYSSSERFTSFFDPNPSAEASSPKISRTIIEETSNEEEEEEEEKDDEAVLPPTHLKAYESPKQVKNQLKVAESRDLTSRRKEQVEYEPQVKPRKKFMYDDKSGIGDKTVNNSEQMSSVLPASSKTNYSEHISVDESKQSTKKHLSSVHTLAKQEPPAADSVLDTNEASRNPFSFNFNIGHDKSPSEEYTEEKKADNEYQYTFKEPKQMGLKDTKIHKEKVKHSKSAYHSDISPQTTTSNTHEEELQNPFLHEAKAIEPHSEPKPRTKVLENETISSLAHSDLKGESSFLSARSLADSVNTSYVEFHSPFEDSFFNSSSDATEENGKEGRVTQEKELSEKSNNEKKKDWTEDGSEDVVWLESYHEKISSPDLDSRVLEKTHHKTDSSQSDDIKVFKRDQNEDDGRDSAISLWNEPESLVSRPRSTSNASSVVSSPSVSDVPLVESHSAQSISSERSSSLDYKRKSNPLFKSPSDAEILVRQGSGGRRLDPGKRTQSAADGLGTVPDLENNPSDLGLTMTQSGSMNEMRQPPITTSNTDTVASAINTQVTLVDEWERKLYGRSGLTGSAENVSISGSRSSLNTSRESSIHDIRKEDSFTRLPFVKALTLERSTPLEIDDEAKKQKRKNKPKITVKSRFFKGGSREKLNEDSRIVEGGNDRLPSIPARPSKLPQEIHDKFAGKSREDLLEVILSLQSNLAKQTKHSHDLEEYIDNLLLRVMEATPHILQAPLENGTGLSKYDLVSPDSPKSSYLHFSL